MPAALVGEQLVATAGAGADTGATVVGGGGAVVVVVGGTVVVVVVVVVTTDVVVDVLALFATTVVVVLVAELDPHAANPIPSPRTHAIANRLM